ncbi:MAG: nickel transporter permease [Ruminococcus sp.]
MKKKLILFSAVAGVLIFIAAFAEYICPYDPYQQNYDIALQPPSIAHPFGTDRYGRDMLSRVLMGSRISIFSTLILVAVIAVAGTAVGLLCGYVKGTVDSVLMGISDVFLAFPGLVFALAIASLLGGGVQNAVIALAAVSWPKYARLARSQTMAVKNTDYISAARLSGSSPCQVVIRHVLPNIIGPVLVTAVLDIGTMIMEIAALSFLGLGASPPAAEWGSMMSEGRSMLQTYPWTVLTPGIAVFVSVMVFNLLGDAVRDFADPRNGGKK